MATLILKPTEKCNSHCAYCDVVQKEASGKNMSLKLLEIVFSRIDEYLSDRPDEMMDIIWHGGEPLLLGPDFFKSALDFQRHHCAKTEARIKHSIQSNLTLLDERFLEIFQALGINQIGSSFDPEPGIRGAKGAQGTAKYKRDYMRGDRLARHHGIGSGIIYVVTKKSLGDPLGIFYFLTNMVGGINFNPVLVYGEEARSLAITPEEFVSFLGVIFPVWWKHRERYPDIQPFRSLVENIRDGDQSLGCVDSGGCAFHHINIVADGSVSHCGRSADWGLLNYGNIWERTLAEILADPQRQTLEDRNAVLQDGECSECRFWKLCHGGCPLDSWSIHGEFMHKSEWCEAKRGFIEQHFEPVTGLHYES